MEKDSIFGTLYAVDLRDKVEKKEGGLTYLSWPDAWAEVKKRYPGITYEIERDPETRLPYVYDERTGFMVFTRVTIGTITHEMWLPVMDGANHAMKAAPYEIKTKYRTFTVAAASMMDINKALMRCLVKNLALFGLGLYIYSGEDLPEDMKQETQKKEEAPAEPSLTAEHIDALVEASKARFGTKASSTFKKITGLSSLAGVPDARFGELMEKIKNAEVAT